MDAKKTGELIAALRRECDLNQQELADRLGVTNKAISRWETGRGYPDIETLPKLSDVLGISIPELLNGERLTHSASEPTNRTGRSSAVQENSIETVCLYAGEQTRKQKKKIVLLSILLAVVVFIFSLFSFVFQVLPAILDVVMSMNDAYYSYADFYWSIVGSSECVVASDHKSLIYLGDKYVPIILKDCDAVAGEIMVDECQVEDAGFLGKLLFGESLYEVKNAPNHELVYLQTDYDPCISRYFVLESKYDHYRQLLEKLEFSTYYSEYCNESWYRWERQLTPNLCGWLQFPDTVAVSEKPNHSDLLNIRVYDADHIFYREAGTIYQTEFGYYWLPETQTSYNNEPDSAGLGQYFPIKTGRYYPINGFDHELDALFSE